MASHLRLLCCVFGLLAVRELPGAEGVTFSLDPVETKVDGQATCGVLHCWEEVKPGSASITSISSLTVYKQEAGRRVTLTTLSREKPIDNGTFDGIEVDGIWTPEKAEVNLSLVEKDDCTQVQFFCQVRYTDGQGRERMRSAVVDGKDATTHEQTEDTPSSESDGKTSVMSGEVLSSTDGTRLVPEEQLNTMVGVSHIQKRAEGTKSTTLKDDTVSDAGTLKEVSKTILETVRTAMTFLTKYFESVKEEVKSAKEEVKSVKEKVKSVHETLGEEVKSVKEEIKSINETMGEEVNSIRETIKEEVKSVKEDVKSVEGTMKEEIESLKWTVRSDRWIVVQRRSRGDVSFNRNWDSYKKGFGSSDGDFWLGNNRIHALTSGARYELRMTMAYEGKIYYANYDSFSIDGEKDNYRLHIGNYKGNAGDRLTFHNNMMFSTIDRDNDLSINHCAWLESAGWWYKTCSRVNLNAKWRVKVYGPLKNSVSLTQVYPATFTEMKIREVIV